MSPIPEIQWRVVLPTAVLVLAGALVWWVLVGPPGALVANVTDPLATPTPQIVETPEPSAWSSLSVEADPSSVVVQTFQGDRIIRSGTGTVMSSDGLIVTVVDAVPLTSPSASYQIIAKDRVFRALVVRRDYARNIALLKAQVSDLTIAKTAGVRPLVGSPLAIVGGLVDISSYRPFFAHAWMSFDAGSHAGLDAGFVPTLAGGRVFVPDGRQVGVVYLRSGRVFMVWMDRIDALVAEYLSALK